MVRQYVSQLCHGDTVEEVFLVAEKHLRANRNGNLYLQIELRDKTGVISSRLWNATEEMDREFDVGDFVLARGKVQLYQGALQIILTQCSPASRGNIDVADFLPQSTQDIDRMAGRLREILFTITNPHLRSLVECFLIDDDFMRKFTTAPAGVKNHHAYVGGLLEHVVNLLETSVRIVDLYPAVDRDLLLAGIFLHDIGKIDELSYRTTFSYTDEGQLIGHLVIGIEMLSRKVQTCVEFTREPFPEELLLRLKHMIVSHHGSYEYGSPKLPMTPEAIALHHLDNLDAKVHSIAQLIRDDPNHDSPWTPYHPKLDRKIFKGANHVGRDPQPATEPETLAEVM